LLLEEVVAGAGCAYALALPFSLSPPQLVEERERREQEVWHPARPLNRKFTYNILIARN
jgi:hypothetical protein